MIIAVAIERAMINVDEKFEMEQILKKDSRGMESVIDRNSNPAYLCGGAVRQSQQSVIQYN